jgi:hypothetical protein
LQENRNREDSLKGRKLNGARAANKKKFTATVGLLRPDKSSFNTFGVENLGCRSGTRPRSKSRASNIEQEDDRASFYDEIALENDITIMELDMYRDRDYDEPALKFKSI